MRLKKKLPENARSRLLLTRKVWFLVWFVDGDVYWSRAQTTLFVKLDSSSLFMWWLTGFRAPRLHICSGTWLGWAKPKVRLICTLGLVVSKSLAQIWKDDLSLNYKIKWFRFRNPKFLNCILFGLSDQIELNNISITCFHDNYFELTNVFFLLIFFFYTKFSLTQDLLKVYNRVELSKYSL